MKTKKVKKTIARYAVNAALMTDAIGEEKPLHNDFNTASVILLCLYYELFGFDALRDDLGCDATTEEELKKSIEYMKLLEDLVMGLGACHDGH